MSTGLIIAIVVVALILIALFAFVLPRMRRTAQVRARERELGQRREQVAGEHREEASTREREADMAERRAELARTEAERQRAEANLHQQRAEMHEQGMADHELIDEHEREHFAPALENQDGTERPVEGGTAHEPIGGGPRTDYEQGRVDERTDEQGGRFQRGSERVDETTADPRR
jgi:FtsZ-interacting cell division protein ZipA